MEKGFLKARHKDKALKLLTMNNPHFTTTQSLSLIDANCGPAKFHRILQRRKFATPTKEPWCKGYDFHLPSEYGSGTYSMNHYSFRWTIAGVKFIVEILKSERIAFDIPQELSEKLNIMENKLNII